MIDIYLLFFIAIFAVNVHAIIEKISTAQNDKPLEQTILELIPKDLWPVINYYAQPINTISSGDFHACAINESNKMVECWGLETDKRTIVPADLGPVRAISAGNTHNCAIKLDGTVQCWGQYKIDVLKKYEATEIPADLGPVQNISSGSGHTCAITAQGLAKCWGINRYGQLNVPADLGPIKAISAKFNYTCAIKTDDTVKCWGAKPFKSGKKIEVPLTANRVTKISVGVGLACGIRAEDNLIECWGDGLDSVQVPKKLGPVKDISLGPSFGCAIKNDKTVECWGPLVDGRYYMHKPLAAPQLGPVKEISAGAEYVCARKETGEVKCWGFSGSPVVYRQKKVPKI